MRSVVLVLLCLGACKREAPHPPAPTTPARTVAARPAPRVDVDCRALDEKSCFEHASQCVPRLECSGASCPVKDCHVDALNPSGRCQPLPQHQKCAAFRASDKHASTNAILIHEPDQPTCVVRPEMRPDDGACDIAVQRQERDGKVSYSVKCTDKPEQSVCGPCERRLVECAARPKSGY